MKGKLLNSGFTLIELVIVVGVIAVLGIIFTNTLIQTLRGQNKVKVLSQVKQNGQVTLEKLSNAIRGAERVICVGSNGGDDTDLPDTVVVYGGGVFSRFRFYPAKDGNAPENGYFRQNNFTADNFDQNVTNTELCSISSDQDFSKVYDITDRDPLNGVSIKQDGVEPVFELVLEKSGYSDVVVVMFRAAQGERLGKTYEAEAGFDGIPFSTAVQVRGGL